MEKQQLLTGELRKEEGKATQSEAKKQKKEVTNAPETLACHFFHMSGCQKGEKCPFQHSAKLDKCPNGKLCPMNHSRILCPTMEICYNNSFYRCDFFHPRRLYSKFTSKVKLEERAKDKVKQNVLKHAFEEKKVEKVQKQHVLLHQNPDEVYQYLHQIPHIFRIPSIPPEFKQQHKSFILDRAPVIGLIDCSGSLLYEWDNVSRYWNDLCQKYKKYYTFAFGSSVNSSRKQMLSQDILEMWRQTGFTTSIYQAFQRMNQFIVQEKMSSVTVIFISDGYDNNLQKLKRQFTTLESQIPRGVQINFICLGICGGDQWLFPTEIAIQLRNMYHNGSPNVPPLVYVRRFSDWSLFETAFDYIYTYLDKPCQLQLDQSVAHFPWSPETKEAYEGQWVYSYNLPQISLKNKQVPHCTQQARQDIRVEDLIDLSKDMLTQLQIMSVSASAQRKLVRQYAQQAIKMISELKLNELRHNVQKVHRPFIKKVIEWNEQQMGILLAIVYQLELLSQGKEKELDRLDGEAMALRLSLNTRIGRYSETAKSFQGCTLWDFQQIKDEFLEKLWSWLPYKKFTSSYGKLRAEIPQAKSVYCGMNQMDIFMEEGMEEGIKQCQTQHQLVHQLPIVGYGCRIRRTDGSLTNPYLISVLEITKTMVSIDSQELVFHDGEIALDNGERFNCVLPLFEYEDEIIAPLIRTKLYSLLMSFNVTNTVDTRFGFAHLALLANAFIYLLNQPESDWKKKMLNKVFVTVDLAFAHNAYIKEYTEVLKENPRKAVATEFWEHGATKMRNRRTDVVKCEDLSKPLLILYWLCKRKAVDAHETKKVLHAIIREIVGRFIPRTAAPECFMLIKNEEQVRQQIQAQMSFKDMVVNKFKGSLLKYYTFSHLAAAVAAEIHALVAKNVSFQLELQYPHTIFPEGKFNIVSVQRIYKFFLPGKDIRKHNMIIWVNHAFKYKSSFHRNNSEVDVDAPKIYQKLVDRVRKQLISKQAGILINECTDALRDLYISAQNQAHGRVELFNRDTLLKAQQQLGMQIDSALLINSQCLLKNACSAPECPYFLQRNKQVSEHLSCITLKVPGLNKVCRSFINLSPEEVYAKIVQGSELRQASQRRKKPGQLPAEQPQPAKPPLSDEVKHQLTSQKQFYLDLIQAYQTKYRQFEDCTEKK